MASNKKKEGIVIALDIGKNSLQLDMNGKSYFDQSLQCVSMIIQRKLLMESKDEIALILFGSSQTNNALASKGPGYQNIEVVVNLGLASWNLAKYITTIAPTNETPSDWLSTLILATDLLKNETDGKIFTDLQIVMFSNFMADISPDKINIIMKCIQMLNIKLSLIGKDYEDIAGNNPLLEMFIEQTEAQAASLDLAVSQLNHYKQKEVVPRAWVVPLSFGNVFSIKVCGYKKLDESPKNHKWLLCKRDDKPGSITPLKTETLYYYVQNGKKKEVNRDDLIDGFRFGDTIIPISNIDKDAYAYKSGQKSMYVLGFTSIHNIHRSCLMSGASYIFKPSDQESTPAFEALFKAMSQKKEVMIVRKVYVANSVPSIGVLYPVIDDGKNMFVYVNLPYAQDVKKQKLPSLNKYKSTEKQKDLFRDLIKSMDLNDDDEGHFMPEYTYSPQHQFLNHLIVQKAINPDLVLPKEVPENIKTLLYPPSVYQKRARSSLIKIKELFSLVSKVDETTTKGDNLVAASNEIPLTANDEIEKPCVITAFSPVEDFNKLLEEGIDSGIVCKTMKNLTVSLIESSSSLEELEKPVSTLKTLREHYVYNKDVNSYNNWMPHIKDAVLLSGKEELWPQFIDSGIGLITNEEVEDSTISQEIANKFMEVELIEDVEAEMIFEDDNPLNEFL
ncbi:X-ray repair cross-complementing protein 5-like [Adelges cooleyi]|uniref:X-ray repair cross-complementing protein 5-like n=1 Tax=Adelges cooleyi TaxID=133065 RepID=UPI00218094FD|nr:X-ray repair cross-complementing protein 5-like [Adelges cooleyi]